MGRNRIGVSGCRPTLLLATSIATEKLRAKDQMLSIILERQSGTLRLPGFLLRSHDLSQERL
jgi:hypothetical protein